MEKLSMIFSIAFIFILINMNNVNAQLTNEKTQMGITLKLLNNTDFCDENCYSIYNVCMDSKITTSKITDLSFQFSKSLKFMPTITTKAVKDCFDIRIDGKKGKFDNVDNIPCFKDVCFKDYAWWNTSWLNCANITLNNSQIFGTEANFPMLINITDNQIVGNKTSIRFVNESCYNSGSEMPFEIELNDTIQFLAWVKLPLISNLTNNVFSIYYNNPYALLGEDIPNTWNSNYTMVLHMRDLTWSSVKDSTLNAYVCNKVAVNTPLEYPYGKIYKSQDFTVDYMDCPNALSLINTGSLEFWLNYDSSRYQGYFGRGSGWGNTAFIGYGFSGDDNLQFQSSDVSVAGGHVVYGSWNYYSLNFGTNLNYYYNGNYVSGAIGSGLVSYNAPFRIGNFQFDSGYKLDGKMDEFRFLNVVKNEDYFKTSYNTQNLNGFYQIGNETEYIFPNKNITFNVYENGTTDDLTDINISCNYSLSYNNMTSPFDINMIYRCYDCNFTRMSYYQSNSIFCVNETSESALTIYMDLMPLYNISNTTNDYCCPNWEFPTSNICIDDNTLRQEYSQLLCQNGLCNNQTAIRFINCQYGCVTQVNQYGDGCKQPDYLFDLIIIIILIIVVIIGAYVGKKVK